MLLGGIWISRIILPSAFQEESPSSAVVIRCPVLDAEEFWRNTLLCLRVFLRSHREAELSSYVFLEKEYNDP